MLWLKTYYNLILWGLLALFLVSGGWCIKAKLDENTTMKTQIVQLQADKAAVAALQKQYSVLDSRLVSLSQQRTQSFTKTDKGAVNAFKTPEFTSNRLTPEQLCYWNDFGDAEITTACLSDAGVSGSPKAP